MMKTNFLYLSLFTTIILICQEPVYKEPWFTVHIKNESENISFMSGYDQDQRLQADTLNPGSKITFRVSDAQMVKVSTSSGIYYIYIQTYFSSDGSPINPHAVFEKIKTGAVSNKRGPVIMFRSYFKIDPFAEQLHFNLISPDTLELITPKQPISHEVALQRPVEAFIPPFIG